MSERDPQPVPAEIQAAVGRTIADLGAAFSGGAGSLAVAARPRCKQRNDHEDRTMIAVFVTFRFAQDFNVAKVRQLAESSRTKFERMPGLRSKLFSVSPELREARNVYVWDDAEAARRFLAPEQRARIAALYGTEPTIEYAEVAALVENSHL